eukprot:m.56199 g.56199  ORF g.56199 m.56199 type:complete len:78 (+) comp6988_c0_seq1:1597-1830(+)
MLADVATAAATGCEVIDDGLEEAATTAPLARLLSLPESRGISQQPGAWSDYSFARRALEQKLLDFADPAKPVFLPVH